MNYYGARRRSPPFFERLTNALATRDLSSLLAECIGGQIVLTTDQSDCLCFRIENFDVGRNVEMATRRKAHKWTVSQVGENQNRKRTKNEDCFLFADGCATMTATTMNQTRSSEPLNRLNDVIYRFTVSFIYFWWVKVKTVLDR